ncbi:hypothetical protein GCM10029992_07790 [Glycomyces albus]
MLTGKRPFSLVDQQRGEPPKDPRQWTGLGELSEEFAGVLVKAVAPQRADRYTDAAGFREALELVRDNVWTRPDPNAPVVQVDLFGNARNPFVEYLQTLYSQSRRSNAGTRAGQDSPFDLYVATALDQELIRAVKAGRHRLVIITGNAGDGKTEFLERLIRVAQRSGGTPCAAATAQRSTGTGCGC